ncbi:MAG: 4-(cytidine 5'-diphospho)-2-C-methyl-D-erythritol kinase [Brevinema sp.]
MVYQFTSTSKINLFLNITAKDPVDNYHFLESIFVEIPWGDDFKVSLSSTDEVIFSGLGAEKIGKNNTVTKALFLFKEKYQIEDCFRIDVKKNVPSGAGLGGGSGDAGALLTFLGQKYNISTQDMLDVAASVGSDVPFFLYGGSAHVSGKGEIVEQLEGRVDPNLGMLIVVPPVHVSTKDAFKNLKQHFDIKVNKKMLLFLKKSVWGLDFLLKNSYNIFTKQMIESGGILEGIYWSVKRAADPPFMIMSGSGSSLVLFYNDPQEACHAEVLLQSLNCGIYTQQIWW